MFFHTLAEFVATILIVLIASGSLIAALFLKLRAKEREDQLDVRDTEAHLGAVEARLQAMEARLGAMEGAIGAQSASLPQPALAAPARMPPTGVTSENVAARSL